MSHSSGAVPTLQRLAVATLIRFRDALGDLGDAPLELLGDVLAACSPAQLAGIEDETQAGSGRCLTPWTWPMWHTHWAKQFGGSAPPPDPRTLPPLPAAAEVAAGEPGVPPADYRALFEHALEEREQRRAQSGARLRALREQEEAARTARHAVVVDAVPVRGARGRLVLPGTGQAGRGGSLGAQGSSQARLLKKLGLGGSRGAAVARPPRQTTVVIRPARAAGAGLRRQQQQQQQQQRRRRRRRRHLPPPQQPPAHPAVAQAGTPVQRQLQDESSQRSRFVPAPKSAGKVSVLPEFDGLFAQPLKPLEIQPRAQLPSPSQPPKHIQRQPAPAAPAQPSRPRQLDAAGRSSASPAPACKHATRAAPHWPKQQRPAPEVLERPKQQRPVPQVLEETDIFAQEPRQPVQEQGKAMEQRQQQQQHKQHTQQQRKEGQQQQQQQGRQRKRAGPQGGGASPPLKKRVPPPVVVLLEEVDIFGL